MKSGLDHEAAGVSPTGENDVGPCNDSNPSRLVAPKNKHLCETCDKRFLKPSQLIRHMRIHTGEKPFQCHECGKSFNQKGTLDAHIQTLHERVKPFTCELCNCKFSHRGNLRVHQKTVHDPAIKNKDGFRCGKCPCVFRRLGTLQNHVQKVHTDLLENEGDSSTPDGYNTTAPDASENVETENSKEVGALHMNDVSKLQISTNEEEGKMKLTNDGVPKRKSFCSYCPKSFEKPSDLVRHVRTHTKERPYKCETCLKSFSLKSTLKTHMRRHTFTKEKNCKSKLKQTSQMSINASASEIPAGEFLSNREIKRSYLCSQCPSSFKKSSHLKQHVLRHSGEQPFQCFICNKRFVTSGVLNCHIRSHLGVNFHKCHFCERQFTASGSLKRHLIKHSNEPPQECASCKKRFKNRFSFKRHKDNCQESAEELKDDSSSNKSSVNEKENEVESEISNLSMNATIAISQEPIITDASHLQPVPSPISQNLHSQIEHTVHEFEDFHDAAEDRVEIESYSDVVIQEKSQQEMSAVMPTSSSLQNFEENKIIETNETGLQKQMPGRNQCHLCGKTFSKSSDLIRHIRIHTGEKPFQCFTCGRRFRVKSTCISHMRIHESSTKTAFCEVCNNQFATMSSLRLHMRLHTGSRPFKCFECNRDFRTAGHFQAHRKSHLKESVDGRNGQRNVQNANEDNMHESVNYISPPPIVELSSELGDSTGPIVFNSGESECLKLLGSLSLPIDNLQNILITSVDMNSTQVDDFFQKFVIINPPVSDMPIQTQTDVNHELIDHSSLELQRLSNVNLNFSSQVSTLDPFLTDASEITQGTSKVAPISQFNIELNETNDKTSNSKQCPDCGRMFSKPSLMLRHQRIHTGEKPHACRICKNTFSQKSSLDTHIMFTHSEVRPFQCSECPFKTVQRAALKKHCSRAHPDLNFSKLLESSVALQPSSDMASKLNDVITK